MAAAGSSQWPVRGGQARGRKGQKLGIERRPRSQRPNLRVVWEPLGAPAGWAGSPDPAEPLGSRWQLLKAQSRRRPRTTEV